MRLETSNKRTPGGQKGNHNARKHGIYSRRLSDREKMVFLALIDAGTDYEIAYNCVKVRTILDIDHTDPVMLAKAADISVRYFAKEFDLDAADRRDLKKVFMHLFRFYDPQNVPGRPAGILPNESPASAP